MTVGETQSATELTAQPPPLQEEENSSASELLNVEIVQNSQTTNNNIQSKPTARMGRRKQIAPQKAAGTDGKKKGISSTSL